VVTCLPRWPQLERRNISYDDVERMTADVEERRSSEEGKSSIPLGVAGKATFFIFGGVLFWSLAAVWVLAFRGYRQKSISALKWIAMGLGLWTFLAFLIASSG
jgi:hypothetical protein